VSSSITWLQQSILASASALVGTRCLPRFFSSFFPLNSPPDELSITEYESFVQQRMVLKAFPFDGNRLSLLIPVVSDPNGSVRPACQVDALRLKLPLKSRMTKGKRRTLPVIKIPKLKLSRAK
jgi:hypothetical protein